MSAVTWDLKSERDLWRAIMAPGTWFDPNDQPTTHPDALWHFVNKAWGAEFYLRNHPEVPQWLYEPIHRPFCNWLQTHILRWKALSRLGAPGRYHIASILPRGYGKTVSTTKAGALWSHLDEPDMSTIICSATADLSRDVIKAIANVVSGKEQDAWFTWLYGDWKKGGTEWSKDSYKTGRRTSDAISEPSFDTTGVDAGMTGYHHRQHWWDDPIIKNKLRDGRDAYIRSVHDAVNASYNACQANGLMAFVLTRYLDDDVAGRHFKEEGIASWSGMECPHYAHSTEKVEWGTGLWHVFYYATEDVLTGEPTHPKLWTIRGIAEAKRRDAEDFACQQQNNPGSGDRSPLIESQIPFMYLSYQDFQWKVPIKWATIHIDTAFKRPDNIRRGDDSAIVVWLADARDNGLMYLDTDLLRASNEWREEDFNLELIRVCLNLRRRGIWIRAITDETEPGGKAGTYRNRILGVLGGAGIQLGESQFITLNRRIDKKARIRTGAGVWAGGFVRCLLWSQGEGANRTWQVPQVFRKLIGQIVRIDVTKYDDLADASVDGFIAELWKAPMINPMREAADVDIRRPGDEVLKSFGKPPTDEELLAFADEQRELEAEGLNDGVRGWSDSLGWDGRDRTPV